MANSVKQSPKATKLVDHIRELRKRIVISIISLILAGVAVYAFYEPLLDLLRSPLGAALYYSAPSGSFAFVMKICFMGALAIAIPVLVFNLIMFIRPAFAESIPVKRVISTSFFSAILAFAGAAFGFYYIVPGALKFFAGFQVNGLNALISADSYLSFVTNVIITFVLVFQLPLIITFIDRIKPLRPRKLLLGEKWVILGSLIVSVLVPFAFDLVTSLLIALPIVVLYNLSVVLVMMQHHRAHRRATKLYGRFDLKNMPQSTLSLDVLSFEDLVGNESTVPAKSNRPVMDVRRVTTAPEKVKPAAWVNKIHAPIPEQSEMRVINDISSRRVSA